MREKAKNCVLDTCMFVDRIINYLASSKASSVTNTGSTLPKLTGVAWFCMFVNTVPSPSLTKMRVLAESEALPKSAPPSLIMPVRTAVKVVSMPVVS